MSKPVKEMMMRDYQEKMNGHTDAVVVSLRGVDANTNNRLRNTLAKKDVHLTMVRNALFLRAFEGTGLDALAPVMTGSNVVAYGGETVVDVAREIVDIVKEMPDVELKGAVLDGQLFQGDAGVRELSKFPTRDEAIGNVVGLILGPGRNLLGQVKGPGGALLGIVKSIEDKLEKGEEIKKVG